MLQGKRTWMFAMVVYTCKYKYKYKYKYKKMLQEKRTWIFVMVDLYAGSPTSRIVVRIFRLGASDPSTKQLLLPGVVGSQGQNRR